MNSKSNENRIPQFTARALKWIACLCMLADHTAKCFSLHGVSFFLLSDLIGRITFPIFCMLLAEGFFHTHSRLRYILRIMVLALISELPYDLVLQGKMWDWTAQNTCFTLLLGLLMFSLLEMVRLNQTLDYRIGAVLQISIIALFAVFAIFVCADYQANGIAALAVFYYASSNRRGTTAAAACLCLNVWQFYNAGAFLSVLPLSRYSGRRGAITRAGQYAFYLFYPMHLLLLLLIRHCMLYI